MATQPKNQNYDSAKKSASCTVDLAFIILRHGQFIHVDANGEAVEIRMDDDGNVGVCLTKGIVVNTFLEVYGE